MKDYSEINLDETPIIVLGCGHFFTSESVDGLVGLDQVYTRDKDGKFEDLRDLSSSLATAIPSCPDCKQPIRQFVTKRYNRVVNRAVMDETYKRFLAKGRIDLANLESRLNDIEHKLNSKGAFLLPGNAAAKLKALDIEALKLSKTMQAENQPMKRLMDAITTSQKLEQDEIASLSARMEATNLAIQEPDSQITLGARLIQMKSQEIAISHLFKVAESRKDPPEARPGVTKVSPMLTRVLENYRDLITQAHERSLYRIVITATISFAKIAQLDAWYRRTHPAKATSDLNPKEAGANSGKLENRTETIRDLLTIALKLCDGLGNCPELQEQVQEMTRLYKGPRYETVTLEELESIKTAMVSGRRGIATHSGHWYNCVNGHPVSKFP